MDIKVLIRDLIKTKNLQTWVNNRFHDKNKYVVDSRIFPYVMTSNGVLFSTSSSLWTVYQVLEDYFFSDIEKNDIVIDIGANIGGFTLLATKLSDKVYAIEPIEIEELKKNIETNKFLNIYVLEGALGDGKKHDIKWLNTSKLIQTYSFTQLKQFAGGCDFLKCDCEGYEWFIKPYELEGVRRIEMEIHNYNPSDNNPKDLIKYITDHYLVVLTSNKRYCMENLDLFFHNFHNEISDVIVLHAKKKNADNFKFTNFPYL